MSPIASNLYSLLRAFSLYSMDRLRNCGLTEEFWGSQVGCFRGRPNIFFFTDPLVSLPKLLHLLRTYGTLSYFQINLSKSSALPISLDQATVDCLPPSFSFQWATNAIRYLEVNITPDPAALYAANFDPLLLRLRADLLHLHMLTLT